MCACARVPCHASLLSISFAINHQSSNNTRYAFDVDPGTLGPLEQFWPFDVTRDF